MAVGEGFVTREAFGIFSRNLDRRIGSLEARLGTGGYGGGGGGLYTFRSLMDTPGSYSDSNLKYVRVNSGESALEFGARMTISASGPLGGDNGDIWLQYGVPAVHALLSDTHSDTLADSVLAGDLIYGNSTPKWARKAKGNDGQFLKMVGGYPDWAAHGLIYSDVGAAASGHNHSGVYEPVIAGGTSAQYWRGDKSFQTLNQAAVAGLTTADGPTFAHLHLSDLAAVTTPTESWVGPSSTTGVYFKGGNVGIGTITPGVRLSLGTVLANTKLAIYDSGTYFAGFGIQADEFRFHGTANSMNFRFYDAPAGNALMTIMGIGNVGIGRTPTINKLEVSGRATINSDNPNASFALHVAGAGLTDATYGLVVRDSTEGNNTLYVTDGGGTAYIRAAAWTVGSDKSLKKNIAYFDKGLDKIRALKPARFDFIEGKKNQLGFVAQDVQPIIPEAVEIEPLGGLLGLKPGFIIPYLVASVQELEARLAKLEN